MNLVNAINNNQFISFTQFDIKEPKMYFRAM